MDESLMDDVLAGLLRKDASLAALVLSEFLAEGKQDELLLALREMTNAFGGVHTFAERVGLNPPELDCDLSRKGNPLLSSFMVTLKNMGMQLRVRSLP